MIYCSLGSGCNSSHVFKRLELKTESYPFDWINSSTEVVRDCIKDDFNKFLDRSLYSPAENLWDDDRVCYHDFYKPFLTQDGHPAKKIFFRHRDPLHNKNDYDYYQRCVERFRDVLISEEHKVFLVLYINKNNDITDSITDGLLLSKFLEDYTSNFTLIAVHQETTGHRSHRFINGNNLKFIQLTTLSFHHGGGCEDPSDDLYLDEIIKELINDIRQSKEVR